MIESIHQVGEPDRVDVEHGGGVGIGAHLRWIARDDQDVAQSRRRGAEHVRQHAQQVAVAARVVGDRLDSHLALDDDGREQRSHAALRPRAVGDVDGVHARRLERAALREHRCGIDALGGHDLDARDQLSAGELGAEARALGERHRLDAGGRGDRVARYDGRLVARHDARHIVADLLDVLRGRPAAPAHDACAGLDHAARVARHVLRGREVDLAVAHVLRQAGVRDGRDRAVGRLDHLLDRFEHAGGAD